MNVWIACHKETGEPEWRFPVAKTKSTAANYIIGGYMTETHEPVEYVPASVVEELRAKLAAVEAFCRARTNSGSNVGAHETANRVLAILEGTR